MKKKRQSGNARQRISPGPGHRKRLEARFDDFIRDLSALIGSVGTDWSEPYAKDLDAFIADARKSCPGEIDQPKLLKAFKLAHPEFGLASRRRVSELLDQHRDWYEGRIRELIGPPLSGDQGTALLIQLKRLFDAVLAQSGLDDRF